MSTAGIPSMAEIASRYQTLVTQVSLLGGGQPEQILSFNPKRFWVGFDIGVGVGGAVYVIAGPPGDIVMTGGVGNIPFDRLYRDCPSVVTGEWFGMTLLASNLIVTECIYLGD